MYHYRLYSNEGVFVRECNADSYAAAKKILNPCETDSIFVVENDNHETKCGIKEQFPLED